MCDNLAWKTRVWPGGGRMLNGGHLMHAEASKGLALSWLHSIQVGWSLFQFSYILVYWCEWVVVAFSIKLHKDPFLTQNKHSKTLSAESYFLNFLLYTDLTELPLKTRFRVRFVPLCLITRWWWQSLSASDCSVFLSLTLQLITPQSRSIEVPGWLLIAFSYPFLLPHTISMLWLSDFF